MVSLSFKSSSLKYIFRVLGCFMHAIQVFLHCRAWLTTVQAYLISKETPAVIKTKKAGLDNAMEELDIHVDLLR